MNSRFYNNLADFLLPNAISFHTNIFEDTLLQLAGINKQTKVAKYADHGPNMRITYSDITQAEAMRLLGYFVKDCSEYNATCHVKQDVYTFTLDQTTVNNTILPRVLEKFKTIDSSTLDKYRAQSTDDVIVSMYAAIIGMQEALMGLNAIELPAAKAIVANIYYGLQAFEKPRATIVDDEENMLALSKFIEPMEDLRLLSLENETLQNDANLKKLTEQCDRYAGRGQFFVSAPYLTFSLFQKADAKTHASQVFPAPKEEEGIEIKLANIRLGN